MKSECVDESTSLEQAALQMLRGHLPFLQVIDARGEKAGELTRDDLLRYLLVSLRKNPDAYTDSLKKVMMVCAPPAALSRLDQ